MRQSSLISSLVVLPLLAALLIGFVGCKPPPNSAPTTASSSAAPTSAQTAPSGAPAAPAYDWQAQYKASRDADSEDVKKLFALGAQDPNSLTKDRTPFTNETLTTVEFFGAHDIDDQDFAIIDKFPNLETIRLVNEKLTDASLPLVGKKHSLKSLALKGMPITDAGIAHLKDLKQLEVLDLSATAITDDGLAILDNMPNLKSLMLALCTGVTDKSVERFSRLNTLTLLDLQQSGVSPERESDLKASLPNCKVLLK